MNIGQRGLIAFRGHGASNDQADRSFIVARAGAKVWVNTVTSPEASAKGRQARPVTGRVGVLCEDRQSRVHSTTGSENLSLPATIGESNG